ncbi:MAG TPA: hypothetical protein PKM25_06665 [Candidatus Ozemobacteraceae bacterium]|nr:hypothetical protein [Candidatus Ozemobacteraceae bacterium]
MKRNRPDGFYAAFDLGTFAVKAVVIERRQARDRLFAVEEESLRPLSEFPGESEYRDHQIQALRAIAARLPLKECVEVAALFNSRELQVKIAELPAQIHRDQIDGVLWFEARKLLSPNFKQEPFILGYRLLRDTPPTALITCVPQSLLIRFTDLYEAAEIKLTGVYSEVFASFALRESQEVGARPTLAFANVGYSSTHLTIFAAGELKFYRHIPAGTNEIPAMAESQDLDVYFQKIRFSFDYFRAVSKLGQIDEIRFIGGGPGSGDFLGHAREYFAPTKTGPLDISARLDVATVLSPGTASMGPNEAATRLLPYLPSIGTLLAHLDADGASNDLLGRLLERRREAAISRLTSQVPLFGGVVGLLVILLAMLSLRSGLSTQLEEVRRKAVIERSTVDSLRIKQAGTRSAANATSNMMTPAEKTALRPLLKPHHPPAELLADIAQTRPEGVLLRSIRIMSQFDTGEEDEADEAATEAGEPGTASEATGNTFAPPPQSVPLRAAQSGQNETNEELRGRVLEIRGLCKTPESLADFSAALVRKGALQRLNGVKCRFDGKSTDGSPFTLKGELP